MSGIYIHIPFCKQACNYCDFHFSTSLNKKDALIRALIKEIALRQTEIKTPVATIYFGGGTPSLLSNKELEDIISCIYENFQVVSEPEITLEANPDDLSSERISSLAASQINRLSIGIQSFFEDDLKVMNRAHSALEATKCLDEATKYFDNISLDLIYGIPGMSNDKWRSNIKKALSYNVGHISSYALTVEPKTALKKLIEKGKMSAPKDEVAQEHFAILLQELTKEGFIHYELSNFGKPNRFSKHNMSYWQGKPYMGIGPSAHSYNRDTRSWNVSNNVQYINAIGLGKKPSAQEILSLADRFNEYMMTGLRTMFGVDLTYVGQEFGEEMRLKLLLQAQKFIKEGLIVIIKNGTKQRLVTTEKGKFLCDGIAADLFIL